MVKRGCLRESLFGHRMPRLPYGITLLSASRFLASPDILTLFGISLRRRAVSGILPKSQRKTKHRRTHTRTYIKRFKCSRSGGRVYNLDKYILKLHKSSNTTGQSLIETVVSEAEDPILIEAFVKVEVLMLIEANLNWAFFLLDWQNNSNLITYLSQSILGMKRPQSYDVSFSFPCFSSRTAAFVRTWLAFFRNA